MRPNLLNKFGGILLLKNSLNGRESGSIQEVLELRGIKTRTGFLNARQIAMPQDGTDARKTVVKIQDKMLHRLLLLRSAGVADAARWRKTTLVTDAYAVRIVTEGMRGMNHSIQRDVEMVADVSPAVVMHMVVAQHLHRITVIAAATAAMHHYHIDVSHRHHSKVHLPKRPTPRGELSVRLLQT